MKIKKTKKLYDKMNVRLLFWKARTAGFLRISLNGLNILVMYSRCFKFFKRISAPQSPMLIKRWPDVALF